MATYHFSTPLQEEDMRKLHVGDVVYLTGHVFTARDMAHLRIRGLLEEGKPLPRTLPALRCSTPARWP